jgi:hypothetical protein
VQVNEAIRRREAVEAVYTMQKAEFAVGVELAKPGRHLVKRLDDVHVGWPPISADAADGAKAASDLRKLSLILFSDALLLAERSALGGKLSPFHEWYPTTCMGSRPGEVAGTVHVRRENADTLTFVAPAADESAWITAVLQVSKAASAELERTATLTANGRDPANGDPAHPPKHAAASAAAAGVGSGLLAGWLRKKGGGGADGSSRNWLKGGRRNWKWRWVVVTNTQFISWYENEKCQTVRSRPRTSARRSKPPPRVRARAHVHVPCVCVSSVCVSSVCACV